MTGNYTNINVSNRSFHYWILCLCVCVCVCVCVCGMWNISIYGISDGFPSLPHFKFTQPITPVCTQLWRSLWNESNPYAVYNKPNRSKINVCHTEPKGFIKYHCISCGIKQNSYPKTKLTHTSTQGCTILEKVALRYFVILQYILQNTGILTRLFEYL